MTIVSFFSAGVSSAVATKLLIKSIDKIIYIHIEDQHSDTLRFIADCQSWFDHPIEIIKNPVYSSVSDVCIKNKFIAGPSGAKCTQQLKKAVRLIWEKQHSKEPLTYVWGLDSTEKKRCLGIEQSMPLQEHIFPLVDAGISKKHAHEILKASGIKRPAMYDLGYLNNNCIGCVKGGMGYFNKIRIDFPDVFKDRAEMERKIGATCITGVYLDELHPGKGRRLKPIVEDCGIFCETMGI